VYFLFSNADSMQCSVFFGGQFFPNFFIVFIY
jgi:hypothetical protein